MDPLMMLAFPTPLTSYGGALGLGDEGFVP
jgi:hypothetical protein